MKCIDCNTDLTPDNRYIDTDRCISCALRYRYCPACGEFLIRDTMRADMCCSCFRENPALADCSCRISTKPINLGDQPVTDDMRTFGVELETEVTGGSENDIKRHIKQIDALMGDRVLMKHDGSLHRGIEIVTRPAPMMKQYAMWNCFCGKPHKGLRSYDTGTCGLHVHVGRNTLTEHGIAKVVCFVNAEQNKKFIYIMAGRTANDYARIKDKTPREAHKYTGDRYEAVNLSNELTIEFRIFRGTLKKESLFKSIEFCDAVCSYCHQTDTLEQSISRTGFVRFVKEQGTWPHLLAFIQARWYGQATELSEQAGWKPIKNCKVPDEMSLVLDE